MVTIKLCWRWCTCSQGKFLRANGLVSFELAVGKIQINDNNVHKKNVEKIVPSFIPGHFLKQALLVIFLFIARLMAIFMPCVLIRQIQEVIINSVTSE